MKSLLKASFHSLFRSWTLFKCANGHSMTIWKGASTVPDQMQLFFLCLPVHCEAAQIVSYKASDCCVCQIQDQESLVNKWYLWH